ncbi:molecular chaperone [Grimontia hollisae]|uniref:Chaperone protein skp n=1 Tax=Grimontia hollisae CIP 101886 TaxID=675812 RepID=D0ICM4_GRIHO|nr:OmpH family outer membrane protein [Grimontia hollisae]AMG30008.1 molecular chaperone [Grimontia hollisae]EEY71642.1 putative outer membrane protein OmpH [Grimontia hollisae CIP 101886]STO42864.1 Outer membrane protein ompH [Grimontia hollisae]STQ77307.1 Outer membrane protein ompH [Grimontia hollisae]
MKPTIKAAGLSLAIVTASMYATAAEAAQKIGYVATGPVIAQMAQESNINEKLRKEFKDQIAQVERLKADLEKGVEKLQRNGELMSEKDRTKLQRELQSMDAEFKLKAKNLQEDQRKRSVEEERKLFQKLQKAITDIAQKEGYDMVIERQAVLYASPEDDLSEKVLKAMK